LKEWLGGKFCDVEISKESNFGGLKLGNSCNELRQLWSMEKTAPKMCGFFSFLMTPGDLGKGTREHCAPKSHLGDVGGQRVVNLGKGVVDAGGKATHAGGRRERDQRNNEGILDQILGFFLLDALQGCGQFAKCILHVGSPWCSDALTFYLVILNAENIFVNSPSVLTHALDWSNAAGPLVWAPLAPPSTSMVISAPASILAGAQGSGAKTSRYNEKNGGQALITHGRRRK
jgi:hypothetical protein